MTTGDQPLSAGAGYDVIVVGAGLASMLAALRLKESRPDIRLCLLEAQARPDESHTWCCFASDLDPAQADWLEPLQSNRWEGYQVHFPEFDRHLATRYGRLTSSGLNAAVETALPGLVHRGAQAAEVHQDRVQLADGRVLTAPLVLDGRGARPSAHLSLGFQKFVGLEIETEAPHGLEQPVVMDARVAQVDGYRFVYVLPLSDTRLLVEDTRYSDGAELSVEALTRAVQAYAAQQGWTIRREIRSETGVLPIVLEGDFDAYWAELGSAVPLGMRALLFHPVTGYCLPQAARMADLIADQPALSTSAVCKMVRDEARQLWREGQYLRLLNRMMFRAAKPDQRYRVLQRFYRLPEPLIQRFYAGHLTLSDRARILMGRPPVPLGPALQVIFPNMKGRHG